MTNELIQNEYPLPKNAYAAFDAISLRNLIINRLDQQGLFTDQNYIGSNLASIIDIISFAFNSLIFYLNQTSSEATFTEAQIFENINKIVKLLDYKPVGYQTSTLVFEASANRTFQEGTYTIPRYSYVLINSVPFSFNEDVTFAVLSGNQTTPLTDISNTKLLYQGIFRENTLYTAAGDPNEIVLINEPNALIDHFNMDVYVYENRAEKWVEYKNVQTMYGQDVSARVYEKRLNGNKQYEVTFGNGINGRQLEENDKVVIYYLESSGTNGIVGPRTINRSTQAIFNTLLYNEIIEDVKTQDLNFISSQQFNNIIMNNVVGSTEPKEIESVEDIKRNAPSNFKSQYRLVTKEDYSAFIKTNFANFISDVKVYSNWDYTSNYLKYFNNIQISPTKFRQILLNQVLFADSSNFNNIYICAIPRVSQNSSLKYLLPAQKEIIISDIKPLKMLTTEVMFVDPIYKAFSLGLASNNVVNIDDRNVCELQILKSSNTQRSSQGIKKDVENVFAEYFNVSKLKLGGVFNYTEIVNNILSIPGIQEIRTVRNDTKEFFNGLSLFAWNPTYPDLDKRIVTSNIELNDFETYYFANLQFLFSKIRVDESSFNIQ